MTLLPSKNWKIIKLFIKSVGEDHSIDKGAISDDYQFLESLGIFDKTTNGKLTDTGIIFFESAFIKYDGKEKEILRSLLLSYPVTIAIQQYLWGIKDIKIDQILATLKLTNLWSYDSTERLTHFLDLLNYVEIINYNKKFRKIEILIPPDTSNIPKNIYIDPARPFSNILWIKKVIGECEGFVYWLDKHFQKEALEWLWAVADANKIKEIKIISLDLGDKNLNSEAKKCYKRFKQELNNKGIIATWATIDSKLINDSHDRWILGKNNYLRNLPNVNAISSGQRSEINLSENYSEIIIAFNKYWSMAKKINI